MSVVEVSKEQHLEYAFNNMSDLRKLARDPEANRDEIETAFGWLVDSLRAVDSADLIRFTFYAIDGLGLRPMFNDWVEREDISMPEGKGWGAHWVI